MTKIEIKSLNNPKNYKIIKTSLDLSNYSNTFISSCFKFYYGKLKLVLSSLFSIILAFIILMICLC